MVLDIERGRRLSLDDVGTDIRGFRVHPVPDAFVFADLAIPVGDLDQGGRTDIMIQMRTFDGVNQYNWALFVLGNDGHAPVETLDIINGVGGFAYAEARRNDANVLMTYAVAAGDFDGNGQDDIATADMLFNAPEAEGRVRLMLFDEPIETAAP